jgi:hypothetical protein
METNNIYKQLNWDLSYLEYLLTTQSDPYYYNALITPISERIRSITDEIKKEVETATDVKQLECLIDLLQRYTQLLQKYYEGHPFKSMLKDQPKMWNDEKKLSNTVNDDINNSASDNVDEFPEESFPFPRRI